jgi:hypothetical protein
MWLAPIIVQPAVAIMIRAIGRRRRIPAITLDSYARPPGAERCHPNIRIQFPTTPVWQARRNRVARSLFVYSPADSRFCKFSTWLFTIF